MLCENGSETTSHKCDAKTMATVERADDAIEFVAKIKKGLQEREKEIM